VLQCFAMVVNVECSLKDAATALSAAKNSVKCTGVWCNMVSVCCSGALQRVAMRCRESQRVMCCGMLQCVAACCSMLQCGAVHYSVVHFVLQRVTGWCSVCHCVLQCVAVSCSVTQGIVEPFIRRCRHCPLYGKEQHVCANSLS